jgi:hypothetical protein
MKAGLSSAQGRQALALGARVLRAEFRECIENLHLQQLRPISSEKPNVDISL